MVFVQSLRIVDAPVESRREVLRYPDDRLQRDEDVGYQSQDGVRGFEVRAAMVYFVVFDDDEAGDGGEHGYIVQRRVRVCPLLLLCGGVRRLEDEDALDEEEDGGGVEELVD